MIYDVMCFDVVRLSVLRPKIAARVQACPCIFANPVGLRYAHIQTRTKRNCFGFIARNLSTLTNVSLNLVQLGFN